MARKPTRGGRREGAGRPREIAKPLRLAIDFEAPDVETLRRVAEQRGVTTSALIRDMVARAAKRARAKE